MKQTTPRIALATEYLRYAGCRVARNEVGALIAYAPRRGSRGGADWAHVLGEGRELDASLARDVADIAARAASAITLTMDIGWAPDELAEVCRRLAEELGLQETTGIRLALRPAVGLIFVYRAVLLTHSRRDRLICLSAPCDGGSPGRDDPGAHVRRMSQTELRGLAEAGRLGWLDARPTAQAPPGRSHARDSYAELGAPPAVVAAARARGISLAKGHLWRTAKFSRSLLAEEERLIRSYYSSLSGEILEPIRRLNMRISEVQGRGQTRAAQVRRLKGRAGVQEARLDSERSAMGQELADRLTEARSRYAPRGSLELLSTVRLEYPEPVCTVQMPHGAVDLRFDPILGRAVSVSGEGYSLALSAGTKLGTCPHGHVFPLGVTHAASRHHKGPEKGARCATRPIPPSPAAEAMPQDRVPAHLQETLLPEALDVAAGLAEAEYPHRLLEGDGCACGAPVCPVCSPQRCELCGDAVCAQCGALHNDGLRLCRRCETEAQLWPMTTNPPGGDTA